MRFTQDLARLTQWNMDVSRMRKSNVLHMILADSLELKHELMPMPDSVLTQLKELLGIQAQTKCEDCLKHYMDTKAKLLRKPDALRQFAEFVRFLNQTAAEKQQYLEEAENVDHLYTLMRSYEVVCA